MRVRHGTANFDAMFDADLLQENILMPNWTDMNTVYDVNLGLDIWIP